MKLSTIPPGLAGKIVKYCPLSEPIRLLHVWCFSQDLFEKTNFENVTLRHFLGLLKVLAPSLRCDFLRQFAVIQRGNLLSQKKTVFLVEKWTIVRKLEWNRVFSIFLPLKRIVESLQNNNGKREKSKLEVRFKELFCLLLS